MENQLPEAVVQQLQCEACSTTISFEDIFCEHCGFPTKGTADEKTAFISNRGYCAHELSEMQGKIKKASTSIFVIGGLTALMGIIYFFTLPQESNPLANAIINLVVAAMFTALGFWCAKQPVAAIISALSLYIILMILAIIGDPSNIIKGIIIKILIIGYLIKGLNAAFEAQKIKRAHNL